MSKLCSERLKEVTRQEKSVQADGTVWEKKRAFKETKRKPMFSWGKMRLEWKAKLELTEVCTS